MSLFIPAKRATVLIPSGPEHDPDRFHLFILLTDPVTEEKLVLIVSVSSVKPGIWHDPTCILETGEHRFITRKSWVDYRTARIEPASKLNTGVHKGIFVAQGTIDPDVFQRICRGLFDSRSCKPKFRDFYLTACGN